MQIRELGGVSDVRLGLNLFGGPRLPPIEPGGAKLSLSA